MAANELDLKVVELMQHYDPYAIEGHLQSVGIGQVDEVFDRSGRSNRYYQWLACLVRLLKPKQVVELGAAAGISTIMMATEMPQDSKLYSVDIDPQAWRWMASEYSSVVKILGDDLHMNIWPKDVDLSKTDIWFIDSLHEEDQLRKEIELYRPFWKKGAVVVFDDIHINEGMDKVWKDLVAGKYGKFDTCETSIPNHWSGFGHLVVGLEKESEVISDGK